MVVGAEAEVRAVRGWEILFGVELRERWKRGRDALSVVWAMGGRVAARFRLVAVCGPAACRRIREDEWKRRLSGVGIRDLEAGRGPGPGPGRRTAPHR